MNRKLTTIILLLCFLIISPLLAGEKVYICRLKYGGGGDWYTDPSSLHNLIRFIQQNTSIPIAPREKRVSVMDKDFFSYPYLYLTGHGNVRFTEEEILRLREHLLNGGFLHADDCYGMDKYFRREVKRIFPDKEFVELPPEHEIFHIYYDFPNGLVKVHEHDGKPAQALGIFHQGRLVILYTYQTDLGDGWEDYEVHRDPPEIREQALKMGVNIVLYALTH